MTSASNYVVPGLHVEDHSIAVPLDWRGVDVRNDKAVDEACEKNSLELFYRVVTAPDKAHEELPLLVFLQGGPGGAGPRPLNSNDEGWIGEAIKHFRVILPDQRGTGRSTPINASVIGEFNSTQQQADYLKRFLADSIVRDFEYLRRVDFDGRRWATLGQSYGGFLTLSYLSLFPDSLTASFTTGGIPGVPANVEEVYRRTYPRVISKVSEYYERYPQDADIIAKIADRLGNNSVLLPNGDLFSIERLQSLGQGFGMKPGFERLHWMLDTAFDGQGNVSDGFLMKVLDATSSAGKELYWTLQEFIYADGGNAGDCEPMRWAAARERDQHPEFESTRRPLMLTGEMCLPWMFKEDSALRPFASAVDLMMESREWGKLYDTNQLAANTVPLQAAVYFDDMYVDAGLQIDTLSRIGSSHYWVSNDFEHDGVHGGKVFPHLLELARNRGDMEYLLKR